MLTFFFIIPIKMHLIIAVCKPWSGKVGYMKRERITLNQDHNNISMTYKHFKSYRTTFLDRMCLHKRLRSIKQVLVTVGKGCWRKGERPVMSVPRPPFDERKIYKWMRKRRAWIYFAPKRDVRRNNIVAYNLMPLPRFWMAKALYSFSYVNIY